MNWLQRLLGQSDDPPEHVQRARETAVEADDAATDARVATRRYWRARDANDHANRTVIDEYVAAEKRRGNS